MIYPNEGPAPPTVALKSEGDFVLFKLRSMSPADNRKLDTFGSLGHLLKNRGEFGGWKTGELASGAKPPPLT